MVFGQRVNIYIPCQCKAALKLLLELDKQHAKPKQGVKCRTPGFTSMAPNQDIKYHFDLGAMLGL